jgi:hypothetical protein
MRRRELDSLEATITALRVFLQTRTRNGLVDKCRDGKRCRLMLDRESICISCDRTYLLDGHSGKRPDYFVATLRATDARFCWVFVEMKSGGMTPRTLHEQLQGGADCVEHSDLPTPTSVDFVPLVLHGAKGLHVSDRQQLDRLKVTFRGVKRTILIGSCENSKLSEVVDGKAGGV